MPKIIVHSFSVPNDSDRLIQDRMQSWVHDTEQGQWVKEHSLKPLVLHFSPELRTDVVHWSFDIEADLTELDSLFYELKYRNI